MTDRLRVVSIVGARPQFVKAAVLSQAIRTRHDEILVHTGQHYDADMSDVFFDEMGIPAPSYRLQCGAGTHAEQTAAMLVGIERVLLKEQPDWLVTFGDTNSTLAGALAAAKLHVPIAHVEAGLRSFNLTMPEEVNRIVVDRVSAVLLCPSETSVNNLAAEGIRRGVHLVGDVMAQALAMATPIARLKSRILEHVRVTPGAYVLATVHRAENTDNVERLRSIMSALGSLDEDVVLPVHPRTRKALEEIGYSPSSRVRLISPLGYLDMVRLLTNARLVTTDSGGLQKEAYWAGVPCVTLREETEWVETVECGWNVIVGTDPSKIVCAAKTFAPPSSRPQLYGDAGVADECVAVIERAAHPDGSDSRVRWRTPLAGRTR